MDMDTNIVSESDHDAARVTQRKEEKTAARKVRVVVIYEATIDVLRDGTVSDVRSVKDQYREREKKTIKRVGYGVCVMK